MSWTHQTNKRTHYTDMSLTADDVGCDLPVTEPVSFHGPTTFSATEVSLLLDPEYGMLYLQNSDTTSALDFQAQTEVAFVCLGHSTTAHSDTLFSCALEIFLLTYIETRQTWQMFIMLSNTQWTDECITDVFVCNSVVVTTVCVWQSGR